MSGQTGIKETIYQIFDIVFPADLGNVALGINEYQELAESFRKLVDVAIEEHDETVSTYINGRIEDLEGSINVLGAQLIEKDAQLQESLRSYAAAVNNYDLVTEENERLENDFSSLSNENVSLKQRIIGLTDELVGKGIDITDLQEQLKSKDEQITKLTEEINKPKANIVIPSQGKSANLQQLMEAARNKPVKSQMDLALSGQTFRGKVELAIPPSYNGGNEETESTFQNVIETIFEDSGIFAPSIPIVEEVTPSQTETEIELGMDADQVVRSDDGPATWGELKALEARIEERIRGIELQTGIVV